MEVEGVDYSKRLPSIFAAGRRADEAGTGHRTQKTTLSVAQTEVDPLSWTPRMGYDWKP